ncbi:glycosyltransferase 87 family protein [Pseudorhodoferax sp. Leaf267]|uniref:glycosyltransferase 87 family protein n=1 Tax=Pseudorhodoferax sp. Leaf267 TaxID=1736316 RepID=UPI000715A0A2|nr:glycosyltransferase 87 family protein [Pseudorhodoferax sp. Leaf267]KQP13294.1 hypothetical protein ASF43_19570 [Pseudorhodoferax sp. Leaf267]
MTPRAGSAFAVCMGFVLVFGWLAVGLGADATWDTRNYHVYNPHALLAGRLQLDLAPAQMQTYFNPAIDLPVHWLQARLSPRQVAFAVGGFQALCAALVFLIARTVLAGPGVLVPALLAALGAASVAFVAQLGTSAGDSSSAVFVLAALALLCRGVAAGPQRPVFPVSCVWIGIAMGLGAGLKLTNAPFAVAMGLVLLAVAGGRLRHRLLAVACYTLGAAASFALATGWWFWQLWQAFGNPLFPQFNSIFGSALASATSVIDTRWGPVNLLERLGWPLWMSLRPHRIHDSPMYNALWAPAYAVVISWGGSLLWRWLRRARPGPAAAPLPGAPGPQRAFTALALFVAASYLVWLKVFSIGRYMIAIELLLPLLLVGCLCRWLSSARALAVTVGLALASLGLGVVQSNFGLRAAWGEQAMRVEVPPIESPATASVLVAAGDEPIAWIFPRFPAEVAILRVSGNFPRSAAFDQKVARTVADRRGPVYVVAQAATPWHAVRLAQIDHQLAALPAPACRWAGWLMARMLQYRGFDVALDGRGTCAARTALDLQAVEATNEVLQTRADAQLRAVGLRLVPGSCRVHAAAIGRMELPYQFCAAAAEHTP